MSNTKQIFQTGSKFRWRVFQWTGGLIVFAIILMVPIVIISLIRGVTPTLPLLASQADSMHHISNPAIPAGMNAREIKEYRGYNAFLAAREKINRPKKISPATKEI